MEKLKKLISLCKCGVFITVNEHRDYYETVEKFLDEREMILDGIDLDVDVKNKMVETDTVVCVHFYPDTPIGSHIVYHYDLEVALDESLTILASNGKGF